MTSTPFCFAPQKEQLFQRIFPQGFAQSDYHLTKIVIHKGLHKAIRNFRSISFSISEAVHLYFPRYQIPIFRGYAHCANTEGTASKQFPRATDQHPTGKERLPNFTPPLECAVHETYACTFPKQYLLDEQSQRYGNFLFKFHETVV